MGKKKYKLSLKEKFQLHRQKLMKSLQFWREKGKTRVSILLVPHNQESIGRVELSINMLAFFSLTSALILLFSFYYGLTVLFTNPDHSRLYNSGDKNIAYFQQQQLSSQKLKTTVKKLKNLTKQLHKVIWGREMSIFSIQRFDVNFAALFSPQQQGQQYSNMNLFSETVAEITQLSKELDAIKPGLENSLGYLETREGIYQSMPQGRPLRPGVGFITSLFGRRSDPFGLGAREFHNGIDFAASYSTPIYATGPGIISELKNSPGGLGMSIRIDHGYGIYTLYGHCSGFKVEEGQQVERGDLIGLMGATGKATGSHVHYEVHIGSDPAVDPKEFINFE